jgi:hypothetical protein
MRAAGPGGRVAVLYDFGGLLLIEDGRPRPPDLRRALRRATWLG